MCIGRYVEGRGWSSSRGVLLGFVMFVGVVTDGRDLGSICDCVRMHVSPGSVPSAREVFENLRVIARRRYGFTDVLF